MNRFRLQFSLMDIDAYVLSKTLFVKIFLNFHRLIDGQEHCSILSQVMSNEFQVYSPKKLVKYT